MGKGGEKLSTASVTKSSSLVTPTDSKSFTVRVAKLNALTTEELRKWAKAYGVSVDEDKEKDALIPLLVSYPWNTCIVFFFLCSFCFLGSLC
jgi:hypothetical protein